MNENIYCLSRYGIFGLAVALHFDPASNAGTDDGETSGNYTLFR